MRNASTPWAPGPTFTLEVQLLGKGCDKRHGSRLPQHGKRSAEEGAGKDLGRSVVACGRIRGQRQGRRRLSATATQDGIGHPEDCWQTNCRISTETAPQDGIDHPEDCWQTNCRISTDLEEEGLKQVSYVQ